MTYVRHFALLDSWISTINPSHQENCLIGKFMIFTNYNTEHSDRL